jgi:hypothetical protein
MFCILCVGGAALPMAKASGLRRAKDKVMSTSRSNAGMAFMVNAAHARVPVALDGAIWCVSRPARALMTRGRDYRTWRWVLRSRRVGILVLDDVG